jgi:glycine cleavage system H protein
MNTPEDLRYSREHEWVRVTGNVARIGITDFAQDSLGDVVFVQLPDVGLDVVAGASISEIESTKSVSDVYVPVSGVVAAVNDALGERPELVNQDPYGAGWMFDVELADPAEVDALMDPAAYRALTEAEG